jgi:PilZ domain
MPKRRHASLKEDLERRRWARICLAIPVFVRGINGQGREFLEFCTLLNESAGGALLAIRRSLPLRSQVSLEIPLPPLAKQIKFRRKIRLLKARVVRITFSNGWNLCGVQFARPLLLS